MSELQIGDRVVATDTIDGNKLEGKQGTIIQVGFSSTLSIGVEFDEEIEEGHDCNGNGRDGFCWYCDESKLEKIVETQYDAEFEDSEQLTSFLSAFCVSEKR